MIGSTALAALVGGCSLSFPMGSLNPGKDDITGSIRPAVVQLTDPEDRRRARAALSTAMDPQGAGTMVTWDNPATGTKGSYTPVGAAYPADSHICRAFLGTTHLAGEDRTIQGTACAVTAGDWTMTDLKPFRKD